MTIEKEKNTIAIFNLVMNFRTEEFKNVNVLIEKGKSIQVTGSRAHSKWNQDLKKFVDVVETFDRTFKVGDKAIYGSYNFDYTNPIKSVGEKTVSFEGKRLSIDEFIWRNWDYNEEKIQARRASWSD